jgi:hypothetical protein
MSEIWLQKRKRGSGKGLTFLFKHSLEKAAIFAGLYSMMGMTGESSSPSTSHPMALNSRLNQLQLSRSWSNFFSPDFRIQSESKKVKIQTELRECECTDTRISTTRRMKSKLKEINQQKQRASQGASRVGLCISKNVRSLNFIKF